MSTLGIIAGSVLGRILVNGIMPNLGRLGSIEPGRYPHPIYGPIVIPPTPSLKPGESSYRPPPKVQITLAGFLGAVGLAAWLYDRSKRKKELAYIPGPEPADPVEECLLSYGWNLEEIRSLKASIDAKAGTGEEFSTEENRILDHIESCLDVVEEQYGTLDMAGLVPCNCSHDDTEMESPGPGGELSGDIMTCSEWKIVKGKSGEDVIKCSEYRATCHPTEGCIYTSPAKPVTARQRRKMEEAKAKRKPLPPDIAKAFQEVKQYYITEILPHSFSFPPALENEIKRKLFFDNVKKFPDPLEADRILKPHMDDLVEELKAEFRTIAKTSQVAEKQRILEEEGLSKNEQIVVKAMAGKPMSMDQIHEETGLPIQSLSAALVNLELKGFINRKPGKIFEPAFFGLIQRELFKVPRGQVILHVQDSARSEDLLIQCLERRGWNAKRVQELQESIAQKMTPGLFTQEPEKLTGGEIMLQEAIDECLQKIAGKPARGRSAEPGLFGDMCGVKMECAEYKKVPALSPRFKVKEVSRCARFQKTVGAPCITESPPKMEGISGDILTCAVWRKNEAGQWKCAEYMTTCEPGAAPREEKPSPTEEYKKEWERAKRKAYQVKAEKVEAGTFDPVHERILKLIEEGNRDQEMLEIESGISHREMNVILNDMVVKDLIVPRQSGTYSAKYKIVPKKEVKAELDPWMMDAPFTDEEQSYANMYTHFPLDWNKEFAKEVGNTENVVRKRLREFGVDELPPELFEALERYRKAVYQGYKDKWKIRAYFPPVSVVGPARYPVHRQAKAEARERKVYESIERARKKVDTIANRAIKGKVPKITIGRYLEVAATNSRIAFGKQYAMLEMQDKPHLSAFAHVFRKEGRELHRQLVEEAMQQGKQVLWAAVKDYPELQDYDRIIDKPTGIEMKISKKKGKALQSSPLGYAVTPRERKRGMKLVYLVRQKRHRKPRATTKDAFHYWQNRPHEADVYATYAYSAEHARELIKKGEVKPYTGEGDIYRPEGAITAEKGHVKPLHTMTHSELVDTPFLTSAELPPFMTWMIDKSKVDEYHQQREFRGRLPYRMRKNLYSWLLQHQDGVKSGRHEGQFSIELPEGRLSFYIPERPYDQTRLWIDRFGVWKEAVGEGIREGKPMYSSVIEEYRKFAEETRRMLEKRPNAPEAPQLKAEAEKMEANIRFYDKAQATWERMREEARREVREAIRKPETAERKPEPTKPRPILRMPEKREKVTEPEQLRFLGALSDMMPKDWIAAQVRRAIDEDPKRRVHGKTKYNAFFVTPEGEILPYNESPKLKGAKPARGTISVHSHSASNWKQYIKRTGNLEPFNPLNDQDLKAFQYFVERGMVNTDVLIMADGRMEVLYVPPEAEQNFISLQREELARLRPDYDYYAHIYRTQGKKAHEVDKELLRDFAKRYGLVYYDDRWLPPEPEPFVKERTGIRWTFPEKPSVERGKRKYYATEFYVEPEVYPGIPEQMELWKARPPVQQRLLGRLSRVGGV